MDGLSGRVKLRRRFDNFGCRLLGAGERKHPHRTRNVLERSLPPVVERSINTVADLTISVVGDADSAWLGYAFKASGDVNAVPKYIVVIYDDVADVDADAKFDPLVWWHRRILVGHAALDLNCTAYRIHGACKLDQHAVAGCLDDAATMLGDGGVNEDFSDRLEPGQCAFLVRAHETAIPGDIRRQHRC